MNPLLFIKPLLGLVKNPVVDILISKTTGAIKHKMDKDKIIRAKEIEGATKIDVAHINAQKDSIKDELVVCTFLGLVSRVQKDQGQRNCFGKYYKLVLQVLN